jgi:hypothetical protein
LKSEDIWGEALHQARERLKPTDISLDGLQDRKEFIKKVRQDIQERTDKSSHETIGKILRRADQYFTIVDVAIQHHPDVNQPRPIFRNTVDITLSIQVTALVWAGLRAIVKVYSLWYHFWLKVAKLTIPQISLNHLDTLENLKLAFDIITTTHMQCEFFLSLYNAYVCKTPSAYCSKELLEVFASKLPGLYADVVVVSVKAERYFNPESRICKSLELEMKYGSVLLRNCSCFQKFRKAVLPGI